MERVQRGGRTVGVGWSWPWESVASSVIPIAAAVPYLFPDHSSAEVDALIKVSDARVQQLTDAFNAFAPKWTDQAAKVTFINDYTAFLTRYAIARDNALKWLIPSDQKYNVLSKAFRQNYPPDGATETKGDWADLYKRLNAAQREAGASPLIDRPPTDLANAQSDSLAMRFYKWSAPFDPLSQATGEQNVRSPEGENLKFWVEVAEWIREHQTGITIGAVGLAAVASGLYVAPILKQIYKRPEPP